MEATLIKTSGRKIEEIQIEKVYPDANKAMGVDLIACGMDFSDKPARLYVDDEGLMVSGNPVFNVADKGAYPHQGFFAGNGVIVGFDEETGENFDCPFTVEEVKQLIVWTNKEVI